MRAMMKFTTKPKATVLLILMLVIADSLLPGSISQAQTMEEQLQARVAAAKTAAENKQKQEDEARKQAAEKAARQAQVEKQKEQSARDDEAKRQHEASVRQEADKAKIAAQLAAEKAQAKKIAAENAALKAELKERTEKAEQLARDKAVAEQKLAKAEVEKKHKEQKAKQQAAAKAETARKNAALQAKTAELEKTNAKQHRIIEPEMIAIKGNCFLMGSPTNEPERYPNERQHKVCVDDFQLGKTEVTKGQFSAFVNATRYQTEAEKADGCYGWTGTEWKKDKKINWRNPGFKQNDDHPVACVSWNDALAYIDWLNRESGNNYRLPSEAQWEYAARAGTTTPFYTGDCISTRQANYAGTVDYNNCGAKTGVYKAQTLPVGSYPANPWGLMDMAGNVWEWTCSDYDEGYSGKEQQCVSKNNAKTQPVLRGGSWGDSPQSLRAAWRGGYNPAYRNTDSGFRLSRM